MEKLDGMSMDITQLEMEKLRAVFPQCFNDNKLDIDKLLSLCGEYIDNDFEKYKFEWKGKSESLRLAQQRSMGTLRPCPDESVDFEKTQNLYIEGDNLEVLKLLQTAYYRKVKMIYIDPPYNTGNDFIYEDDFKDPIARYKEVTQQTTKSNPETMGRYHTNWLNMMYPRLRLAANLLRDDGVIFISIDDKEVHNLRKLCDEVFGEENYIAKVVHKNNSMKNQSKLLGVSTEYLLVYAKNKDSLKDIVWRIPKKGAKDVNLKFKQLKEKGLTLAEIHAEIKEMYSRPKYAHLGRWNKIDDNGVFQDDNLSRENGYKNFTITNPETGKKCLIPPRGWAKTHEELIELQKTNMIWYGDNSTPPRVKDYLKDDDLSVPDNFWYFDNSVDTRWIKQTFNSLIFENAKPLEMLKQAVRLNTNKKDLILDFFSGSATTAHAVMQLNSEDGGNRQFIMVQLPEVSDEKSEAYKAGYQNICEIGKERIRRAGASILAKLKQDKETSSHDAEESFPDVGFKVFKLDTSNLKTWDSTPIEGDSQQQLDMLTGRMNGTLDIIKKDRSEMDLVYEIMLKMGVDLTCPVSKVCIDQITAYSVGEDCLLLISFQEGITTEMIEKMVDNYLPSKIILSEKCFKGDTATSNAKYLLNDHNIELKLL